MAKKTTKVGAAKASKKKVVEPAGVAPQNQPEKKEPVSLLDGINLDITAKFTVVEIKMKNDWRWKVKMLVHKILPKTHHDYKVRLEFDDLPYDQTIDQLDRELEEMGRNRTLFPDIDRREMKRVQEQRDFAVRNRDQMALECETINFVTQTEEIKYKDGGTLLLFNVLDTVIDPLNTQKYRLKEYRAVFTPISH